MPAGVALGSFLKDSMIFAVITNNEKMFLNELITSPMGGKLAIWSCGHAKMVPAMQINEVLTALEKNYKSLSPFKVHRITNE